MPDYIFMLESRLTPHQMSALERVQQEAQAAGLNLYLTGGAVRDLMTGSSIRDLDFTLEGNPLRVAQRLARSEGHRMEEDERLRRAELELADGVFLSLEMARSDSFPQPGQAPEVKPAPILEDLRRRDFSVNAMGISLTPGSRGLLLDPTNGLADIENRELRVLHPYSFLHDPVRLLRLVRFATRLGYKPDARTQGLFASALERGYQDYIRPDSLRFEARQVAWEENAVAVLKALAGHELLAVFHPQLQRRKPDYEGLATFQRYFQQAVEAGYRPDPFYPVLYYIRKRLPTRTQKTLLRNLGLRPKEMKTALTLEREARKVLKVLGRQRKAGPRQIYHLLEPVPVSLLVFTLAEYSRKKKMRTKIYNYLFKYRPLRNKLPARELQLMGVPSGPKLDKILEQYFEALLDGKLRTRAQQLRYLRKLAGLPKSEPKPKKAKKGAKRAEEAKPADEAPPAAREAAPPPATAGAVVEPAPARKRAQPAARKPATKARRPPRARPARKPGKKKAEKKRRKK